MKNGISQSAENSNEEVEEATAILNKLPSLILSNTLPNESMSTINHTLDGLCFTAQREALKEGSPPCQNAPLFDLSNVQKSMNESGVTSYDCAFYEVNSSLFGDSESIGGTVMSLDLSESDISYSSSASGRRRLAGNEPCQFFCPHFFQTNDKKIKKTLFFT